MGPISEKITSVFSNNKKTNSRNRKKSKKFMKKLNPGISEGGALEKIIKKIYRKDNAAEIQRKDKFPWLYSQVRGAQWEFDPVKCRQIARQNPWIYAISQMFGNIASNTDWHIRKMEPNENKAKVLKRLSKNHDERKKITAVKKDHETDDIEELFWQPHSDLDWFEFSEAIVSDWLEVGNSCIVKRFPKEAFENDRLKDPQRYNPAELSLQDPVVWTKEYKETGEIKNFWQFDKRRASGISRGSVKVGSQVKKFDPLEVAWENYNKRSGLRYGISPTEQVRPFLELLDISLAQERDYFARGAITPGAIVAQEYSFDDLDQITDELRNIKGDPASLPVFSGQEGSIDFLEFAQNYKDLDYNERMMFYVKALTTAFGVPAAVLGISPERVNYHTLSAELENYEENTASKILSQIEYYIYTEILKPHFGSEYIFEFEPDLSETSKSRVSERKLKEYKAGLISEERYREDLGYERERKEDENYIEDPDVDADDDDADEIAQEVSRRLERYEKSADQDLEATQKPFAGYADFEACVVDNRDKDNPEAYCAQLHRETTGEWPQEKKENRKELKDKNE